MVAKERLCRESVHDYRVWRGPLEGTRWERPVAWLPEQQQVPRLERSMHKPTQQRQGLASKELCESAICT